MQILFIRQLVIVSLNFYLKWDGAFGSEKKQVALFQSFFGTEIKN
jgi:hypothetical protein